MISINFISSHEYSRSDSVFKNLHLYLYTLTISCYINRTYTNLTNIQYNIPIHTIYNNNISYCMYIRKPVNIGSIWLTGIYVWFIVLRDGGRHERTRAYIIIILFRGVTARSHIRMRSLCDLRVRNIAICRSSFKYL